MKQLIVVADDFGLTKSVNEGIARSYEEGIVTSLNLLPSGEAFDDAVTLAKRIGLDEAGAHLSLTETLPISNPDRIRSLIGRDGRLAKGHAQFFLKYLSGVIRPDEVYTEWKTQMERVIATGLKITNLSSHEHLHILPGILDILIRLAMEYNISAIRYPHADRSYLKTSPMVIAKKLTLSLAEKHMSGAIISSGLISPDHFRGFFDSGNITENVLLHILSDLKDGTTELVCHPGFLGREVLDRYRFHKNSEAELFALTSRRVNRVIDEKKIRLVSYAEFLSKTKFQ